MQKLSPVAARNDLTDRELTKIISGLIGGLMQMTDLRSLRNAVRWCAENNQYWQMMEALKKQMDQVPSAGLMPGEEAPTTKPS